MYPQIIVSSFIFSVCSKCLISTDIDYRFLQILFINSVTYQVIYLIDCLKWKKIQVTKKEKIKLKKFQKILSIRFSQWRKLFDFRLRSKRPKNKWNYVISNLCSAVTIITTFGGVTHFDNMVREAFPFFYTLKLFK